MNWLSTNYRHEKKKKKILIRVFSFGKFQFKSVRFCIQSVIKLVEVVNLIFANFFFFFHVKTAKYLFIMILFIYFKFIVVTKKNNLIVFNLQISL